MKTKDILKNVKKTYSIIAKEFDATRAYPWPEFKTLADNLPIFLAGPAGIQSTISLLDIGCGNGRLYNFLKNRPICYIGLDNNRDMLRIAKKKFKQATFKYGNMLKLPFPNASFDTVWCIAALHHLPNTLHKKALREMKRVLKPGRPLCLTAWNLWQTKYRKYIGKKSHNAYIPWGKDKKILRYYYAFHAAELRDLLKKAGFVKIVKLKSMHNLVYTARL